MFGTEYTQAEATKYTQSAREKTIQYNKQKTKGGYYSPLSSEFLTLSLLLKKQNRGCGNGFVKTSAT